MIDAATKRQVRSRANLQCEYCQLPEAFSPVARLQIEHVTPVKHDGSDDLDNLALASIDCNLRKGSNLTGIDPQTDRIATLFDPRHQVWSDHFKWDGLEIVGLSETGRATIRVMELNSNERLRVRMVSCRAGF